MNELQAGMHFMIGYVMSPMHFDPFGMTRADMDDDWKMYCMGGEL